MGSELLNSIAASTVTSRTARCACGDLQLICTGDPARISMCHCTDCQRRTGSLFSVAAFYPRAAVTLRHGAPRAFTRDSASGQPVTFHFCPTCGSTIFWEPARMPHLIGVAAGAFTDPQFPRPEQAVWVKDKHTWLDLPADMPMHDTNPAPRTPNIS